MILGSRLPLPIETAIQLAGYSAQVQFHDYNLETLGTHYLADVEFVENQVGPLDCSAIHEKNAVLDSRNTSLHL